MSTIDPYLSTLRQYWGYADFRGIQRAIIESIHAGRDTLGLMPTGGGKSITFQVPALLMPGLCIVITPLVALMKDQVQALTTRGIKAAYIHSGLSRDQILTILDNSIFGAYKFLYISPERIGSETFLAKLQRMEVSFITVDEAHCICQWGFDFRPSYLQIAALRKVKPQCPILALTATATPEVARSIQENLNFRAECVFRMSFHRPNLSYSVHHADSRMQGMIHVLNSIPGSCIIYTRNRQHCKDLSEQLNELGYNATYYHAGLNYSEKSDRQDRWLKDEYRVMVATNAFGMGIDKPDVRLVLHADLPDSIEEYFQEAGRAGRDGKRAYSVIVMDGKELELSKRRVAQRFPQPEYIQDAYEKICYFLQLAMGDGLDVTREFSMGRFCQSFHFHPLMLTSALEILDKAGYIRYREADDACSRLRIDATRSELFRCLDELDERIFLSLLRNYGGIFVDYIYLDEDLVSHETSFTVDMIYKRLQELHRRGLISYIPRKRVPSITFLTRRVEKEDLYFSEEVYGKRKESYAYRLRAVQEYCLNTTECRSRLLLRYFGETATCDCGTCDVCVEDKGVSMSAEEFEWIRRYVLSQLAEGPVTATVLDTSGINREKLAQVIDYMRAKEELCQQDFDRIARLI